MDDMILKDVMGQIGVRAANIPDLNVSDFEADEVQTPAFLLSLPININYQGAYARGMTAITMIGTILVSPTEHRIRRDLITRYADTTGQYSLIATLESGAYTAFDTIAVASAGFSVETIAAVNYYAALFTLNINGR